VQPTSDALTENRPIPGVDTSEHVADS
jgi:hypothetical protein